MPDLISMHELNEKEDYIIIDVRTDEELLIDPIHTAPEKYIHMELQTIPAKHSELPKDKLLAFVCAGNIRSAQAAQYLNSIGYDNVCVLDKFSL